MKKLLTLAAAAALSVGVLMSGMSAGHAQTPPSERDYLVQVGKRPVWASELRRQEAEARRVASRAAVPSSGGRFVQQGKTIVWVENGRRAPVGTVNRRVYARDSRPYIPSGGRFIQQGKAQIWVPNDRLHEYDVPERYIADKVGSQ